MSETKLSVEIAMNNWLGHSLQGASRTCAELRSPRVYAWGVVTKFPVRFPMLKAKPAARP